MSVAKLLKPIAMHADKGSLKLYIQQYYKHLIYLCVHVSLVGGSYVHPNQALYGIMPLYLKIIFTS